MRFTNRVRRTSNKTKRKGLRLEGLESRELLAAAIMDGASLDQVDQPAAVIASANSGSANSGPVQFIVNGQQTSGYESVGIVNGGCTGTLISPTHVLTAAHCVESGGGGFIGDTNGTFTVGGETYKTVKVTVHPNYNVNDFGAGYDIAIMELDRPVTGVTPSQINRVAPTVGQTLTLVGFGEAGTTSSPDHGFGVKNVGTTPIDSISKEHISWTLDNANEAATAPGDSGGPAFVNVNGKLVIAGITSGGSGDAHSIGAESFDTRVDTLANWIDGVVSNTTPVDPGGPVDPPGGPVDPSVDPPIDPPGDGGDGNSEAEQLAQDELDQYDQDGNESLSPEELTREFADYGYTSAEAAEAARELLDAFDADGNGELSYAELVASWGGESGSDTGGDDVAPGDGEDDPDQTDPEDDDGVGQSPAQLAEGEMELYDTDQNGAMSAEELTDEFVSQGLSQTEAQEFADDLIYAFDTDGNGELDLAELIVSWGGELTDDGSGDPNFDDESDPGQEDPATDEGGADEGDVVEDNTAAQLAANELDVYDIDNDGSLSIEELEAEMVDLGLSDQEASRVADSLLDSFDADGNGLLSYTELVASWGGSTAANAEADDLGQDVNDGFDDSDFEAESDDMWSDDDNWWDSAFAIDF